MCLIVLFTKIDFCHGIDSLFIHDYSPFTIVFIFHYVGLQEKTDGRGVTTGQVQRISVPSPARFVLLRMRQLLHQLQYQRLYSLGLRLDVTLMVKVLVIILVSQSLFLQMARQLPLEHFTMMEMALSEVTLVCSNGMLVIKIH